MGFKTDGLLLGIGLGLMGRKASLKVCQNIVAKFGIG
jgi:hypothetical protein